MNARLCSPEYRGDLVATQLADKTELIAERVLHHGPIDLRLLSLEGAGSGVEARLFLHASANRLDLSDGGIDIADSDVDM